MGPWPPGPARKTPSQSTHYSTGARQIIRLRSFWSTNRPPAQSLGCGFPLLRHSLNVEGNRVLAQVVCRSRRCTQRCLGLKHVNVSIHTELERFAAHARVEHACASVDRRRRAVRTRGTSASGKPITCCCYTVSFPIPRAVVRKWGEVSRVGKLREAPRRLKVSFRTLVHFGAHSMRESDDFMLEFCPGSGGLLYAVQMVAVCLLETVGETHEKDMLCNCENQSMY
jgi:hypothetical protein